MSTLSFERLDDRVVYAIDYFVSSLQVLGNGQSSPSGSVSVSLTLNRTGDENQHYGVGVNLYLSRTPSFSTSDKLVSQAFRVFPAGQTSSTFEMSVTLPNAQDSIWSDNGPFYTTNVDGPYYIGSVVDPNNFVAETNEVNNANRGGMIDWNVINVTGTNSPPRGLANHAAKSFDGNSRGDLVGFHNQQIWVATSDGARLNSAYWGGWDNTVLWNYQGVGDFDGDGKSDVVGFNQNGNWWVGRSDGSQFEASLWTNWGLQQYRGFYIGDFNGDGRDDVAARDTVGNWKVGYSSGNSFQTTNVAGTWDSSQTWYDTKVGDLNGDGRFDIVSRTEAGQWVAYLGQANGQLTSTVWGAWSGQVHWFDVMVGDLNGDGRDDLVGRTVYGQWWVAKSSASGSTNEHWTTWSPTVLWFDVKLADVEGTGRKSLVGRTDSGQWWVGASDGEKFNNAYWGAWNGDRVWRDVDWTDIDGDGKADLIGRTNGMWWVAKSNGNSFSNSYVGYWAEIHWSSVSGTADLDDTFFASLPTSEFEPGVVTKIFGQVVIDRLNEQIATLSRVQANSNRQFDFSKLIAGVTSQRDYLNAYNQAVDLIMAGTVKDVQIGGPEDLLNKQALLSADRSLVELLPWTTSSNQVNTTLSGEGEDGGPITVDLNWLKKLGVDTYNQLRDSFLGGVADAKKFDKATSMVSNRRRNPPPTVVYMVSATVVSYGLPIAGGNELVSDVNRVNDLASRNASRPVNRFDWIRDIVKRLTTEKPSPGRVMFDDSVSNVLEQLDRNSQRTYADQFENNFAQLKSLVLNQPVEPTPNPLPVLVVTNEVSFTSTQGGSAPAPQFLTISNRGAPGSLLKWYASLPNNLFQLSGDSSPLVSGNSTTLRLSINTSGVPAGFYPSSITIYSIDDPRVLSQTVSVRITITGQTLPSWGERVSDTGRSKDQWYSVPASQMAIRFWMQPFEIPDEFKVTDEFGNVYVNARFSTTDGSTQIPIEQQKPRYTDFIKPSGVTRLRVQVNANSDSRTGWWYRGVLQPQRWY